MEYIIGDLMDQKGILVHGVNCQGVMGSGVALAIKNKWPMVYESYRNFYNINDKLLGTCDYVTVEPEIVVVNAFTQLHYGKDKSVKYVSYDAIDSCFQDIAAYCQLYSSLKRTVYFPAIGAGLGGGNWDVIAKIIDHRLQGVVRRVCVMKYLSPYLARDTKLPQYQNTDTQV